MGKYTVTKIAPKVQQDYATGESVQAQFKGDTDVLFGWFVALKGEDQKETVAQCWLKKGEEFKVDQEVEGELVAATDKQGNQYYKFKKVGGGYSGGKKGSFAPRDYRKEAFASAVTMTMSYAKDLVVAWSATGNVKKPEEIKTMFIELAKEAFAIAKQNIEENISAMAPQLVVQEAEKPADRMPTDAEDAEKDRKVDEAAAEAPRDIKADDIDISDIPF